jgi:Hint domain/RTX calcium-binding nonapeptide repeat (4 copies)/Nidogen-like
MAVMVSGLGGPAGYGEGVFSTATKAVGNNDDGSVAVNITSVFGGGGIDFFGTNYTSIYVNSNGNISFGAANTAYAPALSSTTTPTIAAFWSDVNINNGGNIYWDLDPANGTVTITWAGVRAYSGSTTTNDFQLVLTSTGSGDFTLEYIYGDITWTNGGSGVAQTGFTNGGATDVALPGSGNATTLAGYETYDFGTSDPNGTTDFTFSGGVPVYSDGIVEGTAGDDLLDYTWAGDPDGDSIGSGGDEIYGYGGDDTIDAGGGADTIFAGDGDDTILWDLGDGADTIDGGAGAETDGDTLDITATGTATNTTLTGDGTGSTIVGGTVIDFSDIETFVFDAGTADTFNGSADTEGFSIDTGGGDDWIAGGTGADTIDAGDGADTVYGDGFVAPTTEDLNWSLQGGDAANLGAGFTQNTGTMNVSVSMASTGNNNPALTVETVETQYVNTGAGETYNAHSSGLLFGTGDGDTANLTLDFAPASGSGMTGAVEDVAFRINDVDRSAGNHWDQFTVTAFDADGNPVAVTITPAGNDTVSGTTVTAGNTNDTQAQAQGSVLVEVAGPVSQIVVSYRNLDVNTQGIYFTDVQFTTIPAEITGGAGDTIDGGAGDDVIYGQAGDDVITGGAGADTLDGGAGNDTLYVGAGDTATGGDGDDMFILDAANALGGPGSTITITGDETGETGGDTIDFSGLIDWGTISYTDAESGTATLSDGTTVAFSNIENIIICFTEGTLIATPHGDWPIETLRPGDFVLTRDHGPQPLRWVGTSDVQGTGLLAPIEFARGAFGNDRPLLVSPQHRMLYEGGLATLYFEAREVMVPAKHLVNGTTIREVNREKLRYIHLLFDHHEVIWASGAPSESFHPGAEGLEAIDDPAREELFSVFPELRSNPGQYGQTARTVLKSFEARLLM